jgi:PLP dependent protein
MSEIASRLGGIKEELDKKAVLIAVSKTKPSGMIMEAYRAGQRIFGENKVQEMVGKYGQLPKDIEWHLIGHLQTNKVKYIVPFVTLIHSVDSLKLLNEIDRQALKNNRIIHCLLQIHIAREETKFGLSYEEAEELLYSKEVQALQNVMITGLMGMATNTEDTGIVRSEFKELKGFYDRLKPHFPAFKVLSMGMTSDYRIAVEEGSTHVRIGSAIFGER